MANFISTTFESEFAFYETMQGAAYNELMDNTLVKNPHYPKVPDVQEGKSPMPHLLTFVSQSFFSRAFFSIGTGILQ